MLFATSIIIYFKRSLFINDYIIFLSATSFLDNHNRKRSKSCSWFPTNIRALTKLNCLSGVRGMCLGFTFTSFLNIDHYFYNVNIQWHSLTATGIPRQRRYAVGLIYHSPRGASNRLAQLWPRSVALLSAL